MRDEIKPELLLYGHLHCVAIHAPRSDFDSYSLQPCPAIVGSKPILPWSNSEGKTGFVGCAITLEGDRITVVFNDDQGNVVEKKAL